MITPFLLFTILILLLTHWIFDFVLQSHWMATNKSKDNNALLAHVGVYTIGLFLFSCIFIPGPLCGIAWVLVNSAAHFFQDYRTSRWTSALWSNQDYHNFFVVVGFDQFCHYTVMLTTLYLLR